MTIYKHPTCFSLERMWKTLIGMIMPSPRARIYAIAPIGTDSASAEIDAENPPSLQLITFRP